jgi:prolyl oligopeptidase
MTQRPELYGAVLCYVPLLDMVRFHLFGGGKTWTPEYGSPEDAEAFKAIYAYSPYHHVKAGVSYPPLLMFSADHDDRVAPLHARKFVAEVQAANPGGTTYLRIEPNSGHQGADQVKQAIAQLVDQYAFLFHLFGMEPRPGATAAASP